MVSVSCARGSLGGAGARCARASPGEASGGRPVCVLGSDVATSLFPRESPLGNRIKVGMQTFEVIGVLEKQGSFLGMFSLDNQLIIPMPQFTSGFWSNPDYQIQVKVKELTQLEEAKEELRAAMRRVRRLSPGDPDDFGRVVAFVCSQPAAFMTGAAIVVDGGASPGLL